MFDPEKTKNECVAWIRDFFEENGPGCNAVIGISGGKDSSVVAALCCEALGKDRVIGVLMPNGEQADIDMAKLLVKHLGIRFYTVNIHDGFEGLKAAIGEDLSQQAIVNLPPRLRMSTLYAVSQTNNGRVANTCNLSEDWVGYSTRYGDSVGDFSPCCNLTVAEVKAIGRVLGLPEVLIEKAPSDGLTGKTDEDNLGFTYATLDRYIRTGEIDSAEDKALIDKKHRINLFKLKSMPAFDPGLGINLIDPKPYETGFLLGRFQPVHVGHEDMIGKAVSLCRDVVILIGSSQESGTAANPLSYEQRKALIENIYGKRVKVYPIPDIGVGNVSEWGEYVLDTVKKCCGKTPDLFITGKEERRQSWFEGENGKAIAELKIPKTIDISASRLREMLSAGDEWKEYVNPINVELYESLKDTFVKAESVKRTESI